MKNQKGISMIELVIVLVIILIISSFAIYSARESIEQATITEVYTEISSMKEAINLVNMKKDLDENFVISSGDQYDEKFSDTSYIIYGLDNIEKYNASSVKDFYGFDSIKHTYIINFEEGTVDLLNPITISGKEVRTYEQIRAYANEGRI